MKVDFRKNNRQLILSITEKTPKVGQEGMDLKLANRTRSSSTQKIGLKMAEIDILFSL